MSKSSDAEPLEMKAEKRIRFFASMVNAEPMAAIIADKSL